MRLMVSLSFLHLTGVSIPSLETLFSYKVLERPDYKSRLKLLKLLPLCYWHEFRDICFFYKCTHKYYNINVKEYTNTITGRTRNAINSNLRPNRVRTSLFRDSFFNRTKALSTFKDSLFNYFFNKFIANFDTSRIQTWKTVCPHCRLSNRKNCCLLLVFFSMHVLGPVQTPLHSCAEPN